MSTTPPPAGRAALTVHDIRDRKPSGRKLSMVTCYDAWSARIIDQTRIDCVLVGDSVAMVVHGHPSTLHATLPMMALHTAAVARGLTRKFLIADLPFPTFRQGIGPALEAVDALMKAGAHAVKLEGVDGHGDVIAQIVGAGVPVMGHLGLTPQSIHQLGGFRVQGRDEAAAEDLLRQARELERLGCFAIVLECVPGALAARITHTVAVPTIGIGAGPGVDGQVLVLQDMLGMDPSFQPKFLRTYLAGDALLRSALDRFHDDVVAGAFPGEAESYS